MRKNEQCVKRFLAGVLCAAFVLAGMTACGNTKGAEGSVIAVSKDGTVTDTIREPFDQDYYSQQELQDEVLKAVASYNSGMGNEAITVSKVQVDDGVTDVEMKYRSAEDYAAFNRETFFIGTPAQARRSGFDLNKVYTAVSDQSKTMGMAELFNTDGVLVLITNTTQTVVMSHRILYISDGVEVADHAKAFRVQSDENNQISKEICVIFKEK